MPDVSKMNVDGTDYNVKDAVARADAAEAKQKAWDAVSGVSMINHSIQQEFQDLRVDIGAREAALRTEYQAGDSGLRMEIQEAVTEESMARQLADQALGGDITDLKSATSILQDQVADLQDEVFTNAALSISPVRKGAFEANGYTGLDTHPRLLVSRQFPAGSYTFSPPDGWVSEFYQYVSDTSGVRIWAFGAGERSVVSDSPFVVTSRKSDNTTYTDEEYNAFISGYQITKSNDDSLQSRMGQAETAIADLQRATASIPQISTNLESAQGDIADLQSSVYGEVDLSISPVQKGYFEGSGYGGVGTHPRLLVSRKFEAGNYTFTPPSGWVSEFYQYNSDSSGTRIWLFGSGERTVNSAAPFIVTSRKADNTTYTDEEYNAFILNYNISKISGEGFEKQIQSIRDNVFVYDLYSTPALLQNSYINESTGRREGSNAKGASTATPFLIYGVAYIPALTGYEMCVVRYPRIETWANPIEFVAAYTTDDLMIVPAATPDIIGVGIRKISGDDISADEYAALSSVFAVKSAQEKPLYAAFSMFLSWGVNGCSWDAGTCYSSTATAQSRTGMGWAENIARRNGNILHNYAIGGSSIRTWFNDDAVDGKDTYGFRGMKGLLLDDAQPLYILLAGNTNDGATGSTPPRGFYRNGEAPAEYAQYVVGTMEDITSHSDYHDYPTTYYGYYGRVIEMILAHAPNACIIITSPDTKLSSNAIFSDFTTANQEIAQHYGLPYINLQADPYYTVYISVLRGNHPLALTYSGFAMAMERLFAKCVEENETYFERYNGVVVTNPVAWEIVE